MRHAAKPLCGSCTAARVVRRATLTCAVGLPGRGVTQSSSGLYHSPQNAWQNSVFEILNVPGRNPRDRSGLVAGVWVRVSERMLKVGCASRIVRWMPGVTLSLRRQPSPGPPIEQSSHFVISPNRTDLNCDHGPSSSPTGRVTQPGNQVDRGATLSRESSMISGQCPIRRPAFAPAGYPENEGGQR
jgi:hypothetical protein